MEGLEDFASMLEILFCNDRTRGASEKGRVSLRVRHVTQLAQAMNICIYINSNCGCWIWTDEGAESLDNNALKSPQIKL
jgi:hypothetical protein